MREKADPFHDFKDFAHRNPHKNNNKEGIHRRNRMNAARRDRGRGEANHDIITHTHMNVNVRSCSREARVQLRNKHIHSVHRICIRRNLNTNGEHDFVIAVFVVIVFLHDPSADPFVIREGE